MALRYLQNRYWMASVLTLVLGLVVPGEAQASPAHAAPLPTPQFRRYGVNDGLPSSTVNAVVQDRRGFIWFGGSGGLTRYDGVAFSSYIHRPGNPDSPGSTDITQLVAASDGAIWIGTGDAGVDRLDPATGKFLHWRHDPRDPSSLSDDVVYSLALAPDRSLWIGTGSGLDRLSADGRRLSHIDYLDAFGGNPDSRDAVVGALRVEPDGTLWIGTWSGVLLKRTPDGHLLRVAVHNRSDKPNQIWRIEGQGSDLRIGTKFGLYRIGSDGVARPAYPAKELAPGYVFASARDADGRLWLATLHGVVLDDPHSGLHVFHGQPLLLGGLPGEWTWRVLVDRQGGLWFTFRDGGVAYLAPGWQRFTRFTHVPDQPESLSDTMASVLALAADGTLWVGSRGHVDRLDPVTGEVEHVLQGLRTEPFSMVDEGHGLWFTMHGDLLRYADGKLTPIDAAHTLIKRPEILVKGGPGMLYASVSGAGVVRIDTHTLAVQAVPMPPDATEVDLRPGALGMQDGALWYGNHEGLMRWDAGLGRLAFVPGVARGEDVAGLTFDATGFWLLRRDALEHYDWHGSVARRDRVVGAADGWTAPVVHGMFVDHRGDLWIFSESGLWRLDAGSSQFHRLGSKDGLMNGEFTSDPVRPDPDGPIYVPTQGGVFGFDPARLSSKPAPQTPPQVVISAVTVRSRDGVHTRSGEGMTTLSVGWQDRDLRVRARVASFINPSTNRYRFRLRGFDPGWVDVGAHGEREFAGLGPGDYVLDVMAAGSGETWGRLEAPLRIHVEAAPWMRWWAWFLYVAALALVVLYMAKAWRRRLAQRHRMQLSEQQRHLAEQASAAKTRFLATLSHEIRTPMTGVMGMAELLLATSLDDTQREYTQAMQRSGSMLLKLLNDTLDLARIEAGRLELEPAPFDPRQLIDDIVQLEQGLAQAKGLSLHVAIADDLPSRLIGDGVRIKQVLLNLANNALKFTGRGGVTLRVERIDRSVRFSISDTGPGIPEASQARLFQRFEQDQGPARHSGSGLGLAICRELVAVMGGGIELVSRMGHGSTFHVLLPLPEAPPIDAPTKSQAASPALMPAQPIDRQRVLLVEDDPTVAAVIRGLLERQGHQVWHVANGLAGLAELSLVCIDIVLLDLDLPGVDGFQVARLIRQREGDTGQRMPLIAITARSGGDEEQRAYEAGMDGFLRKPLSGEQLAGTMAAVLQAMTEVC